MSRLITIITLSALFYSLETSAQGRAPAQAPPLGQYCIRLVYDFRDSDGRANKINVPWLATQAMNEAEACNHLVNLVGTNSDRDVTVDICASGKKCRSKTYRQPMIRGGSIARSTGGCEKPELISQVNDLSNPGEPTLRLCEVTLSWDPAHSRNREFVYKDSWVPYGGGLAHVRAGQKNPLFKEPPRP